MPSSEHHRDSRPLRAKGRKFATQLRSFRAEDHHAPCHDPNQSGEIHPPGHRPNRGVRVDRVGGSVGGAVGGLESSRLSWSATTVAMRAWDRTRVGAEGPGGGSGRHGWGKGEEEWKWQRKRSQMQCNACRIVM